MNLEAEVKKLLEEGYSASDILKACEKMKGENYGKHYRNMLRLYTRSDV